MRSAERAAGWVPWVASAARGEASGELAAGSSGGCVWDRVPVPVPSLPPGDGFVEDSGDPKCPPG